MERMLRPLAVLLLGLGAGGCATAPAPAPAPAHDGLDAVTWLQTSTEYAAVTTSIYSAATALLQDTVSREGEPVRPRVIVMDIDETVLDNARYQVQMLRDGTRYDSESWDRWVALRGASPVPGAVDFIGAGQALGFQFAFVTNRSCRARPGSTDACPQHADTMANLESVGIDTASTTLMLRADRPPERCRPLLTGAEQAEGRWSSDKTSRRACAALDHDIVMLFGDQLGDFTEVENVSPGASNRERAAEYRQDWGTRWFMLPNPTYGGWQPRGSTEKRDLLRGIEEAPSGP